MSLLLKADSIESYDVSTYVKQDLNHAWAMRRTLLVVRYHQHKSRVTPIYGLLSGRMPGIVKDACNYIRY